MFCTVNIVEYKHLKQFLYVHLLIHYNPYKQYFTTVSLTATFSHQETSFISVFPFISSLSFIYIFYFSFSPLLVALCWDGLGAAWDVAMIAPHQ